MARAAKSHGVRNGTLAAVLAIAALLPQGCAMFPRYDMVQIHEESAARVTRNPVIVLHGFIGSKLRNDATQEGVWGRFVNAVTRSKTDDLSLPIDGATLADDRDALVPYALYESVAGVKFYGAMMDALQNVGGYRLGDIADPKPGDTCFVYVYDWRRDNVESAIGLGRTLQDMKRRLHAPDMKFDIVAHSMGGMIALYELMYGTQDVVSDGRDHPVTWAGAPDLGRLVLLGTPLDGTMAAFRLLQNGFSRSMSPDVVFTMPSVYQLLPDDGRSHFVNPSGESIDVDLFDARSWVENGWSVFATRRGARGGAPVPVVAAVVSPGVASAAAPTVATDGQGDPRRRFLQMALDRARGFRRALVRRSDLESPVPVHQFGSDCVPTLDRVILKPTAEGVVTLFDDESAPDRTARLLERVLLAPGDGTVTATSLLGGGSASAPGGDDPGRFASTFFVCESHGLLPANPAFQDNLFYVLFHGPTRTDASQEPAPAK
jgi:pimeloyl-ACP methyl ester carboxylesterase